MVNTTMVNTRDVQSPDVPVAAAPTQHRHGWFQRTLGHPARRNRLPLVALLERIDDDPVLLCGCTDGNHHRCD
jgi:hypothetical protein